MEAENSVHPDAGQYKITVENKLGQASATINVKVIGTSLTSFHILLQVFKTSSLADIGISNYAADVSRCLTLCLTWRTYICP